MKIFLARLPQLQNHSPQNQIQHFQQKRQNLKQLAFTEERSKFLKISTKSKNSRNVYFFP